MKVPEHAEVNRVFVSYARIDSDFVMKFATGLIERNVNIWVDQLDIEAGDEWDNAVQQALEGCTAVIVVLSPAAVESRSVMDEVSYALDKKKEVIPILYKPCTLPVRLSRTNYVDLTADYDSGLEQCVALIGGAAAGSVGLKRSGLEKKLKLQKLSLIAAEQRIEELEQQLSGARNTSGLVSTGELTGAISKLAEFGEDGVRKALELLSSARPEEACDRLERLGDASADSDERLAAAYFRNAGLIASACDTKRARTAYERALECNPDDASSHRMLANLYQRAGDYQGARRHFEKSLELFANRGSSYELATAHIGLGNVDAVTGNLDGAERHFRVALGISRNSGHVFTLVGALNNLGAVSAVKGDFEEAERSVKEAIAIAEKERIDWLVATSYGELGDLYLHGGRIGQAQREYEKALQLSETARNFQAAASQHLGLSQLATLKGEWASAERHARASLDMSERIDFSMGIGLARTMLAGIKAQRGQLYEAENMLQDVLTSARGSGDTSTILMTLDQLVRVFQAEGEFGKARDCLDECLSILDQTKQRTGRANVQLLTGWNYFGEGKLRDAESAFDDTIRLAKSEGSPINVVLGLLGLANVRGSRGDFDQAESSVREALRVANRNGLPEQGPHAVLTMIKKARAAPKGTT